jgi:hypothetical protein
MKTSMFVKGIPMWARACTVVGAVLALSVTAAGCFMTGGLSDTGVSEGNRCNPLDTHNECSSGLVCTGQGSSPTVPFCPENYCCSVDSSGNINSSNAFCQPGCAGGAASICKANSDPGACAFADGGSLASSMALDTDAGSAPPATDDAAAEGGD